MGDENTVRLITPEGAVAEMPAESASIAILQHNFHPEPGNLVMTSPEGSMAIVPKTSAKIAIGRGFEYGQPIAGKQYAVPTPKAPTDLGNQVLAQQGLSATPPGQQMPGSKMQHYNDVVVSRAIGVPLSDQERGDVQQAVVNDLKFKTQGIPAGDFVAKQRAKINNEIPVQKSVLGEIAARGGNAAMDLGQTAADILQSSTSLGTNSHGAERFRETQQRLDPKFGKRDTLDPTNLLEAGGQWGQGFTESMAQPEQLAMLKGLKAATPLIRAGANAYFAQQMARNLPEQAVNAMTSDNSVDKVSGVIGAGTDAAMLADTIHGGRREMQGVDTRALGQNIGEKVAQPVQGAVDAARSVDPMRQALADKLRASAAKQYEKVLNPTTKQNKNLTENKVVPGLLDRGVLTTSPEALAKKAGAQKDAAGQAVNDIWDNLPEGTTVEAKPLLDSLESYKGEFQNRLPIAEQEAVQLASDKKTQHMVETVKNADGTDSFVKVVDIDPESVNAITDLQRMVANHGEQIPASAIRKVRQVWDTKVAKAGGFAGNTMTEGSKLAAAKELVNVARGEIAKLDPSMKDANAEYAFWANVERVAEATKLRRVGQQGGMKKVVYGAVGGALGTAAHPGVGTIAGVETGKALSAVQSSPFLNTLSALTKNKLANIIRPSARTAPELTGGEPPPAQLPEGGNPSGGGVVLPPEATAATSVIGGLRNKGQKPRTVSASTEETVQPTSVRGVPNPAAELQPSITPSREAVASPESVAPPAEVKPAEAPKPAATWREFVQQNMSEQMKATGSHGEAMKVIGKKWKERNGVATQEVAPANTVAALDVNHDQQITANEVPANTHAGKAMAQLQQMGMTDAKVSVPSDANPSLPDPQKVLHNGDTLIQFNAPGVVDDAGKSRTLYAYAKDVDNPAKVQTFLKPYYEEMTHRQTAKELAKVQPELALNTKPEDTAAVPTFTTGDQPGPNYSSADVKALKAKNGIQDEPVQMVGGKTKAAAAGAEAGERGKAVAGTWRSHYDSTDDVWYKKDILKHVATGKSTSAELADVLDRLQNVVEDTGAYDVAWDISHNNAASPELKSRAQALYDSRYSPSSPSPRVPEAVASGKAVVSSDKYNALTRRIDESVFQDRVPESVQQEGQRLLTAIKQGDVSTIQKILDANVAHSVGMQGGGGSGPGNTRKFSTAKAAIAEVADAALRQPPVKPVASSSRGAVDSTPVPEKIGAGDKSTQPKQETPEGAKTATLDNLKGVRVTRLSNASDLVPKLWSSVKDATPEPFMGKYELRTDGDGYYTILDGDKPIASMRPGAVVVDKAYRRQGIATELVKRALTDNPNYRPESLTVQSKKVFEKAISELPKSDPSTPPSAGGKVAPVEAPAKPVSPLEAIRKRGEAAVAKLEKQISDLQAARENLREAKAQTPEVNAESKSVLSSIQSKGETESSYGTKNTVVTKAEAATAAKNLRSKLGKMNAGIPVDALPDMLKVGAYHLEAGAREFGAWSAKMVGEFGDAVKPHLQSIWGKISESEDYRGLHTAPMKDSGSPLHDLSGTYPDDVYSGKAAQYYGHYGQNHPLDRQSIATMQALHNRPNAEVKIYRAVPENLSNAETIYKYEQQKRYMLKHGKLPPDADPVMSRGAKNYSEYYDRIDAEMERLRAAPSVEVPKMQINTGDWVTINRQYAKEHGESALDGKYKILSKTVKAKDIFTNGDSIHEWGYDPQPNSSVLSSIKRRGGNVSAKYETGKPATISYIHNTEKSPNMGARFGQDVEPAGRYIQENTAGYRPEDARMETGTIAFKNPLVIPFGEGYRDAGNWKNILSKQFGGKTGKALSAAIKKAGHDGIITTDKYGTSEIVDLTGGK